MPQNNQKKYIPLSELSFAPEWFAPEVREGFYVSEMMKRYWAAQLKVLQEIDAVCRRHEIPWFMDYGSLLGAVRHGGYVPWDDDFDITMLRHDFDRFMEVAKQELPEGYVILTPEYVSEYTMYLPRIVNTRNINFAPEHLDAYYGCPYTVGIDIYILEGLYEDEEKEEERRVRLNEVYDAADVAASGGTDSPAFRLRLKQISEQNQTVFSEDKPVVQQLLVLANHISSECASNTASHLSIMYFWAKFHNHRFQREWAERICELPFEHVLLNAPLYYDRMLRTVYGDYFAVRRGGGMHDYPVYREQELIWKEKMGSWPWRYTFSGEESVQEARADANAEKLAQMEALLSQANVQAKQLGETGEEVAAIQLEQGIAQLARSIDTLRTKKKEIVFLPVRAAWWDTMRPMWENAKAEEHTEVTVIAVPYLRSGPNGGDAQAVDEGTLFPEEVHLTKPSAYDFGTRHPDMIVIQHPYDDGCNAVALPEFFHAKNLRKLTDCLVYIPGHDAYTPDEKDFKAQEALRVLIEQPALFYADEVRLPTEEMRKLYVDMLCEIAGKTSRPVWEKKIVSMDCVNRFLTADRVLAAKRGRAFPSGWEPFFLREDGTRKRTVLWYFTLPFFLEHGADAVQKCREVAETFTSFSEDIACVWKIPMNLRVLEETDAGLWRELTEVVSRCRDTERFLLDESDGTDDCVELFDAYYGTQSDLMRRAQSAGIPVMIAAVLHDT